MSRRRAAIAGLLLVCAVVGLWWATLPKKIPPGDLSTYADPVRDALLVNPDPFGDDATRVTYLDQGWEPRHAMDFYTRTQGSRLVPYPWFLALEQAASDRLFRDPENVARWRFLSLRANAANPDGLPVGFARDPARWERFDWLGFNCAACHTTELRYNGTAIRIDGAPALADVNTFLTDLTRALKATLDDPAKFERFAARVLTSGSDSARDGLRHMLARVHAARAASDAMNRPPHPPGFGRIDAFGRILNRVMDVLEVPDGVRPPDAPVSYPFLWDTPHHDFVQWNASARNKILGSDSLGGLARNVGEVIGVFGELTVAKPGQASTLKGYPSSARVPNLLHLEDLVRKLQSPRWPSEFPPIDEGKRARGEELFARYCARCHHPIDRADPCREVRAVRTPLAVVGTDPKMATNFATRRTKTGRLEGRLDLFMTGSRFGPVATGDELLAHVVVGAILNAPVREYTKIELSQLRHRTGDAPTDAANLLVYKSRPLNGVWATAPFLHNGSVPSLFQLLLPADRRVTEFHLGRREFDPVNVGFRIDAFPGGFRYLTTLPGNSNAGHEYGAGKPRAAGGDDLPALTDAQRWELVEYLKSL
jgi:hypothetical protein